MDLDQLLQFAGTKAIDILTEKTIIET